MSIKRNPFYKFLGEEDHLQHNIVNYVKDQYNINPIACNTESKKTPFERYKFKYLGNLKGTSDLFIPKPNKKYSGLFIELKKEFEDKSHKEPTRLFKKNGDYFAGKKGEHIKAQHEVIKSHLKNGYYACFSIGFEKTKEIIDKYFNDDL